jgi:hypothetical protein
MVEVRASARPNLGPTLDSLVHLAMEFAMRVSVHGMVEYPDHIIQHLVNRDIGMLPSVYNTWCDVLEDSCPNLTSWLVQVIREMIF